jgi:hypothetical protein
MFFCGAAASTACSLSPQAGRGGRRGLRQQPQPQILRDVRILVLVDQDELEALLILLEQFRVQPEQADALQEQVAEVGGVERLQPLLIRRVELLALAVGKARGFARRHLLGGEPAVLPAVDQRGEHAAGPALFVQPLGFQELLEQPDLVVGVEDGEVGFEADQFGMPAEDLHADGVEGAHPGHALDHLADHVADPLLHLARGLVGEGDGQDFRRMSPAQVENVGDPRCQDTRFPGSRAGQHQHGAVQGLHRCPLLRVHGVEVRHGAVGADVVHGACGYAPAGGLARRSGIVPFRFGHCDSFRAKHGIREWKAGGQGGALSLGHSGARRPAPNRNDEKAIPACRSRPLSASG